MAGGSLGTADGCGVGLGLRVGGPSMGTGGEEDFVTLLSVWHPESSIQGLALDLLLMQNPHISRVQGQSAPKDLSCFPLEAMAPIAPWIFRWLAWGLRMLPYWPLVPPNPPDPLDLPPDPSGSSGSSPGSPWIFPRFPLDLPPVPSGSSPGSFWIFAWFPLDLPPVPSGQQ